MTPNANDPVFDVAHAAQRLGVSHDTIYKLVRTSRLGCTRHPSGTKRRAIRFSQTDLDAYLASAHVPPASSVSASVPPVVTAPVRTVRELPGWDRY